VTMIAKPSSDSIAFDPLEFRRVLGRFATGVTVVSYESEGEYLGATVNSFTSVSMEPPLVLVSLMTSSRAATRMIGRPFAINVLGHDQHAVALQFAGKPQDCEVEWDASHIAPRIAGSHAVFVCTPWATHEAGDHILVLGRVHHFEATEDGDALTFYKGRFGSLGDA